MTDSLTTLYQASPPVVSSFWRLRFLDPRESSHNDLFALLHYINLHIEINVPTVLRTWDEQTPVYWIQFGNVTEALVARGFASDAEGNHGVKVTGALVREELFQLAEEEELHPTFKAPIEPNRWDDPLKIYAIPTPTKTPTHPPATPTNTSAESHTHQAAYNSEPEPIISARPLHERIQRASLLERLTSAQP
ncbi:hypothetical protein EYR36_003094 [Pleurotus pulmonarius]|nr:hypothetical protein EYR36_003094 [Pleurotus pulmonarius]KAF4582547.1 hypothetical protein EYR38_002673 [Pleurotus pulmonarius]KAF4583476.1 hypothetical protein EYR38_002227 [Pleurotus pulmonarius]